MLVATTVIEVGVDVPNATIMIVQEADRFGLAQLHQLRGRVGRGAEQSYCLLISRPKEELTDVAQARLQALVDTTDGFELAEVDLELRGEGQLLGTRQSGWSDLRFTRLRVDRDLLERARELARELARRGPAPGRTRPTGSLAPPAWRRLPPAMRIIAGAHRASGSPRRRARHAPDLGPRARERVQPDRPGRRRATCSTSSPARARWGSRRSRRGAASRVLRRVRPRRLPHDQREPRQARPARDRPLPGRRSARSPPERRTYDLVLCDPPYDFTTTRGSRPHLARLARPRTACSSTRRPSREPSRPRFRRSTYEPPASTAPHALPCSSR